jgi:hypothetical protein
VPQRRSSFSNLILTASFGVCYAKRLHNINWYFKRDKLSHVRLVNILANYCNADCFLVKIVRYIPLMQTTALLTSCPWEIQHQMFFSWDMFQNGRVAIILQNSRRISLKKNRSKRISFLLNVPQVELLQLITKIDSRRLQTFARISCQIEMHFDTVIACLQGMHQHTHAHKVLNSPWTLFNYDEST